MSKRLGDSALARDRFFFNVWNGCRNRREAGGFFFAQSLVGAVDEPAEVPAVDVFVGGFAGGVVAARQNARLEFDLVAAEGFDHLDRVLLRKGEVVVGVHDEHVFAGAVGLGAFELIVVADGTDGGPEIAHPLLCETGIFDSLANVARALAGPNNVAKRSGSVIKGVDAQAWIVCAGEVGVAGTEAGSKNAEVLVTLIFKPVEAAADFDHSLAAC